jgi:hypothetical protein
MLQEENKLSVAVITEISFAAVEFMILQCSFYRVGIWTVRFMSAINEYEVQWEEKKWKSCWIVIEMWCIYMSVLHCLLGRFHCLKEIMILLLLAILDYVVWVHLYKWLFSSPVWDVYISGSSSGISFDGVCKKIKSAVPDKLIET